MKLSTLGRGVATVATLVGVVALPATAAANIIQNGSFEDGYPATTSAGLTGTRSVMAATVKYLHPRLGPDRWRRRLARQHP
jgi:hypothetical protein